MSFWLLDSLMNLVSNMGTSKDTTTQGFFVVNELTKDQLETMFRSDWVARKIVTIPARDATRAWRQWQAENKDIESLEETERSLKIQQKTYRALQYARLYGGGALVLGVADAGAGDTELIPENVGRDGLKFVHAVSRYELSVEGSLELDLNSPYFGEPQMYVRNMQDGQQFRIHPSRVIRFNGEPLPDPTRAVSGWGESVLQAVYDAVRAAGVVSQGVASMVAEAKVDVIKVPELTKQLSTTKSSEQLIRRFTMLNQAKSITNSLILDSADEWQQVTRSFGTLPDVMKVYLLLASGAADIPATRMLGQSPSGLHATGDHDTRNYYDRVSSDQEMDMTPAMSRLDEVLVRSSLGSDDPSLFYSWNPLWQMNDAEKADIILKKAQAFQIDVSTMLVPTDALTKGRQNQLIEDEVYPGLEAALEQSDGEIVNPMMEAQLAQQQAIQAGQQQHEQQMAKIGGQQTRSTQLAGHRQSISMQTRQQKLQARQQKTQLKAKTSVGRDEYPVTWDYSAEQARAPKGSPGGGQWTAAGETTASKERITSLRGGELSKAERNALGWYQGAGYEDWNKCLRNNDAATCVARSEKKNNEYEGFLGDAIKAVDRSKLDKDAVLYRGFKGISGGLSPEGLKNSVGKTIELDGLTSTTRDREATSAFSDLGEKGSVTMEIFAPKGSSGYEMKDKFESEVVLPHKSRFYVDSVLPADRKGSSATVRLVYLGRK